jgi:glycine cleavage system H protein
LVSKKFNKNESCVTLESVKAAEDVYAPIGGEVTEINQSVEKDPSIVNKDAYSSWMIKVVGFNLGNCLVRTRSFLGYILRFK